MRGWMGGGGTLNHCMKHIGTGEIEVVHTHHLDEQAIVGLGSGGTLSHSICHSQSVGDPREFFQNVVYMYI